MVIDTGSVSESARILHLTQPTISKQLKRLQEAVGEPLYVVHQQRIMPTDAGYALYNLCNNVFGEVADFKSALVEMRQGAAGHCKIAMVNTAQYVLPRLLGPYSKAYPNVELTVEIGNRQQVLERFEQGLDDIYVFSHPPSLEHATAGRFLLNPLVVVAAKNDPLSKKARVTWEDVKSARFLLREPGSATRMMFDSVLQSRGLTISDSIQMASNEAIRTGVASGMGLALLSQHVIQGYEQQIDVLNIDGFPLESHWHFIVRNDRYLSKASRGFLKYTDINIEACLGKVWAEHGMEALLTDINRLGV
nr:LysR family transcriptional regulator [Thaumasiovibrio subtropicus]